MVIILVLDLTFARNTLAQYLSEIRVESFNHHH